MNKPAYMLAAALMLGTASCAYAQRGAGDAPPQMDRAPKMDSPSQDAGPSAARERPMRRSEGPSPEMRDGPPAGEPRRAVREDVPGPRDTKADEGPSRVERRAKSLEPPADETLRADRKADRERRAEPKGDIGKPKSTVQEKSQSKSTETKTDDSTSKATSRGEPEKNDAAKADANKSDGTAGADRAAPELGKSADGAKDSGDRKADTGGRKAPEDAKKADLSGERKDRVRSAFRGGREVKHRTDIDINVIVGARLPSAWDYAPVPVTVVEVVPEYRGYVYAYVDGSYVITDPVTYEVVAVLPGGGSGGATYAGGGGGGSGATTCTADLTLTDDERALIVKSIQIVDEVPVSDVSVGWTVPRDIELKSFPEPVVDHSGQLAACRYFIADDQIAIVDPAEDTVVLLIEQE